MAMRSSLVAVACAENIMRFVIEKNNLYWVPVLNVETLLGINLSNDDVLPHLGMAVSNLISKAKSDITSCKEELEEMDSIDTRKFSRCALMAARYYFKQGYSPKWFLSYCAIVMGAAMELYKTGQSDIPNCAVEVIGIVLTAHILTRKFSENGGYHTLMEFCKQFNDGIEMQKAENTPQDGSPEQVI